jgi:hypothetical protein
VNPWSGSFWNGLGINARLFRFQSFSPDISCSARNPDGPERRLAVGFTVAMTRKTD